MATLTTLDAITKTWYMNSKVISQMHSKSVLYDRTAKKGQLDVSGKNYTYAARTGRNRYAGRPISEGGDFGTIGSQTTANFIVPDATITTGIELSTHVIESANAAGKAAFASAFTIETEGGMEDTIMGLNRMLNSDGTDARYFWTTADDNTAAACDDGQGHNFPFFAEDGITLMDVVDASDLPTQTLLGTAIPLNVGAETGTTTRSVSWASGTISGTADGDFAVLTGSLGKAMMGIRGIVSDANPPLLSGGLHGIDVTSSNAYWKSQMFGNSGTNRPLTKALMQSPLTQIALKSSGSEASIDLLLCNGAIRDKYIELLVADQIHPNVTVLKGGQTSVDFNGKQLVVDAYCQRNCIYYLDTSVLDFLTASNGISFVDEDGRKWKQKIGSSGYADAVQAFLRIRGNLATTARNRHAKLFDITD